MCQKAHPKRRLIVTEEAVAAAEAEPEAAAVAFVRPSCVVWKEGSNPIEVERRIRYIIWRQREGAQKKKKILDVGTLHRAAAHAGRPFTVLCFRFLDICGPFAACSTVGRIFYLVFEWIQSGYINY